MNFSASITLPAIAIAAAALLGASPAMAQQAGSWSVSAGLSHIAPSVDSDNLTLPSGFAVPNAKVDVGGNTRATFAINYMVTDNINLHLPVGTGFKNDVTGDGNLTPYGKLAETRALPVTLIGQYRFLEANARVRPYIGAGLSYVKFYKEQATPVLAALTNPGGGPVGVSFQSKLAPTFQLGAVVQLTGRWFVEGSYTKTFLKTRATVSTGHTIDVRVDPNCYTVQVGYRF